MLAHLATSPLFGNLRLLNLEDNGLFPGAAALTEIPPHPYLEELSIEIPPTGQAEPEALFRSGLFRGGRLKKVRLRSSHGLLDPRMARTITRRLHPPELEWLDLVFCQGSTERALAELSVWKTLSSLRHLGLVVNRMDKRSHVIRLLKGCENLTSLALNAGPVATKDPLNLLVESGLLGRLERLVLNCFVITDGLIEAITWAASRAGLRHLVLGNCCLPQGSGSRLAQRAMPWLEVLKVDGCTKQPGEVRAILDNGGENLQQLHCKDLSMDYMGDDWLSGDRWPVLKWLRMAPPTEKSTGRLLTHFPSLELVGNRVFDPLN